MFKKILQSDLLKDFRQILFFMKKSGARFGFFSLSIIFSIGLTLFNLYTVSLLFPLVQGIIKSDFSHVKDVQVIKEIISIYPSLFNTSIKLFILLVVWIYLSIIFKNILRYVANVSNDKQAKIATQNIRSLLFNRCLSFGKSFYDQNKTADIHRIITRSAGTIEGQFKNLQNFIIDGLLISMYLGAMLIISWKLTIISVIAFPFVNLITKKIILKIRTAIRRNEELSINLNNWIFNILSCLPIIKSFGKEKKELESYQLVSQKEVEEVYRAKKISNLLGPLEDIGSTTSILMLALGMAFIFYVDKSLDPTNAFVFFYLAQNLMNKRNIFNNFKYHVIQASKTIEDINVLLNESDQYLISYGSLKIKDIKEGITFKNLNFSYNQEDGLIIKNFNLFFPAGKISALVGPTGSGKSTIASLLLRLYECPANSIMVDKKDIRDFDIDSWRQNISVVSQDNVLFNNTLYHNLSYGADQEISEEKIKFVCKQTTAADFIESLPEKYNTIIQEHGSNFSGGEKQRIAISRALLRDFNLLILDEATSALDAATEEKVMDAIYNTAKGKTVIIISHRLSTIKKADHIVYLKDGQVKESGNLKELSEKKGLFYNDLQKQKI